MWLFLYVALLGCMVRIWAKRCPSVSLSIDRCRACCSTISSYGELVRVHRMVVASFRIDSTHKFFSSYSARFSSRSPCSSNVQYSCRTTPKWIESDQLNSFFFAVVILHELCLASVDWQDLLVNHAQQVNGMEVSRIFGVFLLWGTVREFFHWWGLECSAMRGLCHSSSSTSRLELLKD